MKNLEKAVEKRTGEELEKSKYISRTGVKGNYKYKYKEAGIKPIGSNISPSNNFKEVADKFTKHSKQQGKPDPIKKLKQSGRIKKADIDLDMKGNNKFKAGQVLKIDLGLGSGIEEVKIGKGFKAGFNELSFVDLEREVGAPYMVTVGRLKDALKRAKGDKDILKKDAEVNKRLGIKKSLENSLDERLEKAVGHKYTKKIRGRDGKWVYFYGEAKGRKQKTQEELRGEFKKDKTKALESIKQKDIKQIKVTAEQIAEKTFDENDSTIQPYDNKELMEKINSYEKKYGEEARGIALKAYATRYNKLNGILRREGENFKKDRKIK